MVTRRLSWHLEKNINQAGFRKNKSTDDQINRLQDKINRHINNGEHVLAVFTDFERAFDMIWRKGLLLKLKSYGINGRMFNWIADFLNARTFEVKIGIIRSVIKELENGSSQGSNVSPLLFLCMINDLPEILFEVETALFADDDTIYKAGKNVYLLERKIQGALNALTQWCRTWGFKVNTAKTHAVLFTHATRIYQIKLEINGVPIKEEGSTRFLGALFDRRLTWNN